MKTLRRSYARPIPEDPDVKVLQNYLNTVRRKIHGSWLEVAVDGKFGKATDDAVKAFQTHCNISADGIVGPQTWQRLDNFYKAQYFLTQPSAQDQFSSRSKRKYDTTSLSKKYPILKIIDVITDVIDGFSSFIPDLINQVGDFSKVKNPAILKGSFMSYATRFEPKIKELNKLVKAASGNRKTIDQGPKSVDPTKYHKSDTASLLKAQNAQRQVSKAVNMNKFYYNEAISKKSREIINDLKKFDLYGKVDKFLKKHGLSGEIKLDKIKAFKGKNIKISAGGLLRVYALKDLIWDLCQYKDWGTEEWKQDFKKDLYDFLDGLILGFAAGVLAEIAVSLGIAAAGLTISAGWVVLIIAIVGVLIACLLAWVLDMCDKSFTETLVEWFQVALQWAHV